MSQETQLRKRKWKRLFRSVAWPTIAGGGILLAGVATGQILAPLGFVGMGLLALGTAVGVYRWTLGGERLTEEARADLETETAREHVAYLKTLRGRMRRDRDPRTTKMVKKLKDVYDRLTARGIPESADSVTKRRAGMAEVHQGARGLYQSCLDMLERSLELWNGARKMATESSRAQLLKSRDEILDQVEESINHLDRTLDQIQVAKLGQDDSISADNSQLQQELEQGLEVARRVEERMRDLEHDLRMKERT